MSLITDKLFYDILKDDDDIVELVDGRLFNPAREEIDEDEDKIPYIIISHDGTVNNAESKDDMGESDSDTDTISVLVVAESRSDLADLAELVRSTIQASIADLDDDDADEYGFELEDYDFSAGSVNFDSMKPCCFQTLTYKCVTNNI